MRRGSPPILTHNRWSPARAAAVEFEEPDWHERFAKHVTRWPAWPRYLAEDSAFEATLKDYRRWHAVDGKPASASDGMVALAKLRIFPARNLIRDIARGGECFQEQHDAHCWVVMSQRAWRVTGIEDQTLFLDSFGETTQVSLEPRKWLKHTEKAVEALEAMRNT